ELLGMMTGPGLEAPEAPHLQADKHCKFRLCQAARAQEPQLEFYENGPDGVVVASPIPLNIEIPWKEYKTANGYKHLPATATGVMSRDTIFFNAAFDEKVSHLMEQALVNLDRKKKMQEEDLEQKTSNILVFENSIGGMCTAGRQLTDAIKGLKHKVDILAQ